MFNRLYALTGATLRCPLLLSFLFASLFSSIFTSWAQADTPLTAGGYDLHLFRPAVDSKGQISVNGTEVLGKGNISFGLILDGGWGLIPFESFNIDGSTAPDRAERNKRLVRNTFSGVFHFNYGLTNWLVLGLDVPVYMISGPNVTIPGIYNDPPVPRNVDYQGFGNLGLHAKARLLRAPHGVLGLATVLRVEAPTGQSKAFAGDPGWVLWPSLVGEWHPTNPIRVNLEVGYRYNSRPGATLPVGGRVDPAPGSTSATSPVVTVAGNNITYDDLLTFGAGASFRIARPVDFVAEVYGNQLVKQFGDKYSLAMEALGGFKVFVERNSYLMFGAGAGLLNGFNEADVRGVLSFIFEPSIGDKDHDGIKDDVDQCPTVPEDLDGFQDEDGCPDPDNDKDGILDVNDACPDVPEDFDHDQDEDGCPEGDEGDRDGDGIPDAVDRCPDEPEDLDGFEDEDGCPDPDNDKDGILDKDDLCPNQPEDRDGFQDKDGCPDPDNDGDRILDRNDACPNEPETYNGKDDTDGCPDKGLVIIEENQILILEKIYFETDSAEIQSRSFGILDAVAATMNGNPQIRKIEIQGHADERGNDDYNLRLTRDRAASVREALIQRGVDPTRMRSGGYGERCPVDPGHTPAAWDKNRRVEFKILATDQGPTGVQVICPAGKELVPKD